MYCIANLPQETRRRLDCSVTRTMNMMTSWWLVKQIVGRAGRGGSVYPGGGLCQPLVEVFAAPFPKDTLCEQQLSPRWILLCERTTASAKVQTCWRKYRTCLFEITASSVSHLSSLSIPRQCIFSWDLLQTNLNSLVS